MKKQYVAPQILCVDLETEGTILSLSSGGFVQDGGNINTGVGNAGTANGGYGEKGGRNSSFRDDYGSNW